MMEHRQTIMQKIGAEGCYFLCLIRAAEDIIGHKIDAVVVYQEMVAEGRMREDCWLYSPEVILSRLTGERWAVDRRSPDYKCTTGQVEVLRYERTAPAGLLGHFVLGDGGGKIAYNPLEKSLSVEQGTLVSKRVFTRLT